MTRSCRPGRARHSRVAAGTFDGFRRRGARSGDGVRRPEAPPRPARLRAVEPVVDRGSLFPATDGFGFGGNNQHTTRVFAAMISHRTRSHGRGTHAGSSRSPAPHTHVAKGSGAPIGLPQSPCLLLVPGTPGRRCHRDPAAGSVGVGYRGKRFAVASRSTLPSGVGSR
jgi:hypothetical protein